jgi:hypothetical protein
MRNGQNKRMRGRNRKSHNPLTRVYESNGPDIKIRGTANHVAEKYVQLARDAQSSGDPVAAENYYQHAEHYFRMIAAVQEQFRQNQPNFYRPEGATGNDTHGGNDMQDESFDDGEDEGAMAAPTQGGGDGGGEQPSFGTRDPQPYLPRDAQFFSPREQQYGGRPQQQGGERHQRGDEGNVDRLPSFITGGQQSQPTNQGGPANPGQQAQNGYEGHGERNQGDRNQGDRFPLHRRRRRHRGPRGDMQRGGAQDGADEAQGPHGE